MSHSTWQTDQQQSKNKGKSKGAKKDENYINYIPDDVHGEKGCVCMHVCLRKREYVCVCNMSLCEGGWWCVLLMYLSRMTQSTFYIWYI